MNRTTITTLLTALMLIGSISVNVLQASDLEVTLYKNPQCGCCENYAKYLRENGFDVNVKPTHELVMMSREAGLPDKFQGCHLAMVGGYFVSGHVPVAIVDKLLTEGPDIKGITLPGMPQGSPGMSGIKTKPFTIYSVNGGKPQIYAVE